MKIKRNIFTLLSSVLLIISPLCYAIVIGPNTIINSNTSYVDLDLDMSHGNFIVKNNATLTIDKCRITGILSAANPTLITVERGTLVLNTDKVQIETAGIMPHPLSQSLYYLAQLNQASAKINDSHFTIDTSFSAGLLITAPGSATKDIEIKNNTFKNFHGVLYLLNTSNASIENNIFDKNSYGNIVLIGNKSTITNNKIYFSGLDRLGNAMDILDSQGITIKNNILFTPTCHGIYVLASQHIIIDGNIVTGDITYAMTLLSLVENKNLTQHDYAIQIAKDWGKKIWNNNITEYVIITNNLMSQNRYGIAATDVTHLRVANNVFSQRFSDDAQRKFWTDNAILLRNVNDLRWVNNKYKEAFTQINGGDNSHTMFVTFPELGGVVLP